MSESTSLRDIPSIDDILRTEILASAVSRFGRPAAVTALRAVLEIVRAARLAGRPNSAALADVANSVVARLEAEARPNIRPVFNLTGTILHTNLGRALLADAAVAAATIAMREAIALEFDLGSGRRGERDSLVRDQLCALTGAEAATVVNNNAAAVLLVLNTIGTRREAVVSRGELIEIGGVLPSTGNHGARRGQAGRGGHHQPHAPSGLCGRDRAKDRTGAQGSHIELPY